MKQIILVLLALVLLFGCTNQNNSTDKNQTLAYPDINSLVVDKNIVVDTNVITDTNKPTTPVVKIVDINYSNLTDLDISQNNIDYPVENYEYTPSEPI